MNAGITPFPLAEFSAAHLVLLGFPFAIVFAVQAVAAFFIYRAQDELPAEHQKIAPGLAFLLLVPGVGFAMGFVLAVLVPNSFLSFFQSAGVGRGGCGKGLGLAWAGCAAACCMPCLGCVAWIPALVFLILFLVKISALREEVIAMRNDSGNWPPAP